jgi:hypothetical protein
MSKLDLKRLIATLEKRKPSPALGLKFPHRAQIAAQRRKLAKRLEPFFVNAGLDVVGINKVLAESQNELRRVLRGPPSQQKKTFADAQKTFRRGIANRRKALEYLAGPIQPPFINYITLDTPFFLWTHDAGILVDSHMEPWNSWAKIYWDLVTDDYIDNTEELRFYFLWTNPSDSLVAVNINTSLMVQGYISMGGNDNFLVGGFAGLVGGAYLDVNQWGGEPPSSPPPADAHTGRFILEESAPGSSLNGLLDAHRETFDLVDVYDLQINYFAVPAHANVVFQVSLACDSLIDRGGVILVDFANNEFDNKIICPYVQLELYGPASG